MHERFAPAAPKKLAWFPSLRGGASSPVRGVETMSHESLESEASPVLGATRNRGPVRWGAGNCDPDREIQCCPRAHREQMEPGNKTATSHIQTPHLDVGLVVTIPTSEMLMAIRAVGGVPKLRNVDGS